MRPASIRAAQAEPTAGEATHEGASGGGVVDAIARIVNFGLLAGTLNGTAMGRDVVYFNADDETPTNTGQAIMALDIARFGPIDDFKRNVDAVIREMRHSERLPGVDAIRVPGDQSHRQMAERSTAGIPIRPALLGNLEKLAVELGIASLDIR